MTDRKKQNHINRNFGKDVERHVAKLVGGHRVPMSGAIKHSVFNLEGDVRVDTLDGKRTLALIECKGSSKLTPKGDKVFSLKKSVLDQMKNEGHLVRALPLLWLHWKDSNYERDDYVIIPAQDFLQVLEDLKTLYRLEYMENDNDHSES